MKEIVIAILVCLIVGCDKVDTAPPIDLSGRYVYDPTCLAYHKVGTSYFPFIDPDTVPFSTVSVDQQDASILIIRYQVRRDDGPTAAEKQYDLHDKRFHFENGALVFVDKADHHDFAVVSGKRITTIRMQKNALGALVFNNTQRIKSLAIPIFPVWTDVTHTGKVTLAAADTNAIHFQTTDPEWNTGVSTR
jgi:hypothetical protein